VNFSNKAINRALKKIQNGLASTAAATAFLDAEQRYHDAISNRFVQWSFRIGAPVNGVRYVAYAPQKVEATILAYVRSYGEQNLSPRAKLALSALRAKKKRRHLWKDADHVYEARLRVERLAREI